MDGVVNADVSPAQDESQNPHPLSQRTRKKGRAPVSLYFVSLRFSDLVTKLVDECGDVVFLKKADGGDAGGSGF